VTLTEITREPFMCCAVNAKTFKFSQHNVIVHSVKCLLEITEHYSCYKPFINVL